MGHASYTVACGGYEYHTVHVTVVGRVDDILRRDIELRAGSRGLRVHGHDVAIRSLNRVVGAIASFEIR